MLGSNQFLPSAQSGFALRDHSYAFRVLVVLS